MPPDGDLTGELYTLIDARRCGLLTGRAGFRNCNKKHCKRLIPPEANYRWKTCPPCRVDSRNRARLRRAAPLDLPEEGDDDDEEDIPLSSVRALRKLAERAKEAAAPAPPAAQNPKPLGNSVEGKQLPIVVRTSSRQSLVYNILIVAVRLAACVSAFRRAPDHLPRTLLRVRRRSGVLPSLQSTAGPSQLGEGAPQPDRVPLRRRVLDRGRPLRRTRRRHCTLCSAERAGRARLGVQVRTRLSREPSRSSSCRCLCGVVLWRSTQARRVLSSQCFVVCTAIRSRCSGAHRRRKQRARAGIPPTLACPTCYR